MKRSVPAADQQNNIKLSFGNDSVSFSIQKQITLIGTDNKNLSRFFYDPEFSCFEIYTPPPNST